MTASDLRITLLAALVVLVPTCAKLIMAFVEVQTAKLCATLEEVKSKQEEIGTDVKVIGNGKLTEREDEK